MAISNSLMKVIKNFTIVLRSVAIVIQLNRFMLLLCLLTSIPMFILNLKISEFKYSVYSKRIEKSRFAQYLKNLMLNYNSVKEIKLSRLGKYFENLIFSVYKDNFDKDKYVEKNRLVRLSIVDCLSVLITYCYKLYVIIKTITKGLGIGSMNMYMPAITSLDDSIKNVLNNMSELYSNNLYIENLFYVLELKPIIVEKRNPKILRII